MDIIKQSQSNHLLEGTIKPAPFCGEILYGNVPIKLRYAGRLKPRVFVMPSGEVREHIPQYFSMDMLLAQLEQDYEWIVTTRRKMFTQICKQSLFETGDLIPLFGKDYPLQVIPSSTEKIMYRDGDKIILKCKEGAPLEHRKKIWAAFCVRELKPVLEPILIDCCQRFNEELVGCTIRDMKTLYGSCSIKQRTLRINGRMACCDLKYIETLVIHELCHLKYWDHGYYFQELFSSYQPNWRRLESEYNQQLVTWMYPPFCPASEGGQVKCFSKKK